MSRSVFIIADDNMGGTTYGILDEIGLQAVNKGGQKNHYRNTDGDP